MTGKDLFQEIGMIKEEYVVEAEEYKRSVIHNTVFRRSIVMAACLVVCFGIYWGMEHKPAFESYTADKGVVADYTMNDQVAQAVDETIYETEITAGAAVEEGVATEAAGDSMRKLSVECLPAAQTENAQSGANGVLQATTSSQPSEKDTIASTEQADSAPQKILEQMKDIIVMDFEVVHGNVQGGQEQWDTFLEQVRNAQETGISIIQYTDEGDPICTILNYNTKEFRVEVDNSQDKWAADTGTKEYSFTYLNILQEENSYEVILSAEPNLTKEQLYSGEYETFRLFQYNLE